MYRKHTTYVLSFPFLFKGALACVSLDADDTDGTSAEVVFCSAAEGVDGGLVSSLFTAFLKQIKTGGIK